MSILNRNELRTMTTKTIAKILGHLHRGKHEQTVAATLAAAVVPNLGPADHDGSVLDIVFVSAIAAAAGESMVIDVTKNGVSILTGTYTFNNTKSGKSHISLGSLIDKSKNSVAVGDIIRCSRTYTPGGTPTMTATCVIVEYAKDGGA